MAVAVAATISGYGTDGNGLAQSTLSQIQKNVILILAIRSYLTWQSAPNKN